MDHEMSILLENAWHEMIDTGMDIDDSRYDSIMIFEISGDELLTAYDAEGNEVRHVDSDMHGRGINFFDDYYFIKYAGKATKQYNKFAERRSAEDHGSQHKAL
jgi:hypothetical protein